MATGWLARRHARQGSTGPGGAQERHPADRVVVAGREAPMFSGSAGAVDWLVGLVGRPPAAETVAAEDWLMFRGDAERNAAAPAAPRC